MPENQDWQIAYDHYDPKQQHLRESLCTLGNGYFASRGAFEFAEVSYDFKNNPHYPGTYLAGIFNKLKSTVADREIENESIVNWPNWLYLTFEYADGSLFSLDEVEILTFHQQLNLREGQLKTDFTFRDDQGRESKLASVRAVSMADRHLAVLEWELKAINWSGEITILSGIDGNVKNKGVPRYDDLNGDHLEIIEQGAYDEEGLYMHSCTSYSEVNVVQAIRTEVVLENESISFDRQVKEKDHLIMYRIPVNIKRGQTLKVSKVMAIFTSKDAGVGNLIVDAQRKVSDSPSVKDIQTSHCIAWKALWNRSDIKVKASNGMQVLLRLHIFHLLQVASPNTLDLDVSVPSRGLHGEAYRGNLMWDELYIFPVINYMKPSITQNMLKYRFYRMGEARRAARSHHYKGAMFPWQSGSNGQENAQEIHLNPESGRWIPDDTHLQRHVNVAIAFNIRSYFKITNDQIFMEDYGAEMMFSITQFLASLATYNDEKKRYEIKHVVGPDEYHTSYPDSDEPGLNNNAYTNIMVAWVMKQALKMHDTLPRFIIENLDKKLSLTSDNLAYWKELSEKMYIPFIEDGIIEQFEGYSELKELDWEAYRNKYGNIQRLDRILESEGDTPNRYKVSKQADVLMLFYLLTVDELQDIFNTLGYSFTPDLIIKNIVYYEERTSHGSTLSRLVHSWVMARAHRKLSWKLFEEALKSDVEDIQGGTTTEGIHLGAMAGTIDMVQRAYTGAYVDENGVLWLDPSLPHEINFLSLTLRYRGQCLYVQITKSELYLRHEEGWKDHICIGLKQKDKVHSLSIGESVNFDYKN
ncbi:glycoside hydrolase family 65 protein [Catalinimonas niigatensis]|uniref:glycoside hydrolase family 65 protein n=1 Tax=Catalinimonas niigatensis TaxID=1397264 RepID=UPI002665D1D9|nr:glycosyl hydrolase family 65 protein [Catalinimonas niigatensis]WPP51102.1 glycosyl hydrolase family 65 protein [Catalinimonas niigatensis]